MSVVALNLPPSVGEVPLKINEMVDYLDSMTCVAVFDAASSWQSSGNGYSITIAAVTHGLGTNLCVDIWASEGSGYAKYYGAPSSGWKATVSSAGDVTLWSSRKFAGKIVIK
ncbi:MAG: hypothetical protein RR235_04975 [Oscillospiraceae bacterium]